MGYATSGYVSSPDTRCETLLAAEPGPLRAVAVAQSLGVLLRALLGFGRSEPGHVCWGCELGSARFRPPRLGSGDAVQLTVSERSRSEVTRARTPRPSADDPLAPALRADWAREGVDAEHALELGSQALGRFSRQRRSGDTRYRAHRTAPAASGRSAKRSRQCPRRQDPSRLGTGCRSRKTAQAAAPDPGSLTGTPGSS
jgi:hypothetical protein